MIGDVCPTPIAAYIAVWFELERALGCRDDVLGNPCCPKTQPTGCSTPSRPKLRSDSMVEPKHSAETLGAFGGERC